MFRAKKNTIFGIFTIHENSLPFWGVAANGWTPVWRRARPSWPGGGCCHPPWPCWACSASTVCRPWGSRTASAGTLWVCGCSRPSSAARRASAHVSLAPTASPVHNTTIVQLFHCCLWKTAIRSADLVTLQENRCCLFTSFNIVTSKVWAY